MKNAMLKRVLDLDRSMAEIRTLASLLDYVLAEAIRLVGGQQGVIALLKDDGSLEIEATRDGTAPDRDETTVSIVREVVTTAKPLVAGDVQSDPRWRVASGVDAVKARSAICVPLTARGK